MIDKLMATFHQASEFPRSGRLEPELERKIGTTRSLLRYPHRIFYYPETSPVPIGANIHGKRDPQTVVASR